MAKNSNRVQKINNLIALMAGKLSPREIKAKRTILCIQWDEEDPDDGWNIYLVDGKKVNHEAYLKAIS
jgi:hypothetical protein